MNRQFSGAEALGSEQLEAFQLTKLRRLVERTYHQNPFYRELWDKAGVGPEDVRSLADFRQRFPSVEKGDCLADEAEHGLLGRRLGVSPERVAQIHLTSGTTGVGQEAWGLTQADVELTGTLWMQQYHWMGLERGDLAIYSMPVAFFANGLSAEFAGRKMGMVAFNLFGMDKGLVWQLMERFQPHYVFGTMAIPSMAGTDDTKPREFLTRLKGLSIASMSTETMEFVSDTWGAPLYELYGCTQASSVVGATCERSALVDGRPGTVHFLEEHFIVECLNRDTGAPAEAGEDCEIFLTTLDREASPAIRFRMHDRATYVPSGACPCGRTYHGYTAGSIARWDDMMKIKGINIWPATMDGLLMAHPEIREYRGFAEVEGNREIMRLVVDFKPEVGAEPRAALLGNLRTEVKARTFVNPVVEEATEPLPDFVFKPKRWTDNRK